MKSFAWTTLLMALVFGIGWTSGLLADRDDAPGIGDRRSPRSLGGSHRGSGRGFGPSIFHRLDEFGDELGLSDDQLRQLDQIMEETSAEIERCEREKWEIKSNARPQVLTVFTDEQLERLNELVDSKVEARCAERMRSQMEWIDAQAQLDDEARAEVEGILGEFQRGKRDYLSRLAGQESWPQMDDFAAAMRTLSSERDERLAEYLSDELIEQLPDSRDPSRRRR